jgi:hypothetical protein
MKMCPFADGMQSRKNGKRESDNPHDRDTDTDNHCAWWRGFMWGIK